MPDIESNSSQTPGPVVAIEVTRVVTREVEVTPAPGTPTPCRHGSLAAADEIVVGALLPLSQSSLWPRALSMQAGLNLAADELAARGGIAGKPLRLVVYDTQGQSATAQSLARRLITEECAVAIVDGLSDAAAAAVRDVTEEFGVPYLVLDAAADELTASRPRALFRLAPTNTMAAQMPARWLAEVGDYNGDGAVRASLIVENTPAGNMTAEQVAGYLTGSGIAVETLQIDLPTSDFSPQIARIVTQPNAPDAIFLVLNGDPALDLQRQLLDAGIGPDQGTLLVTGRLALDGPLFWQRVPNGAGTIATRRGPWPTSVGTIGQAFANRYQQYFGQWPDHVAFAAYDAVLLLADSITRAQSLQPEKLVAALDTTDLELAAGRYRFPVNSAHPPDGATTPDYLWHQWPDPPLLYLQYGAAQQPPATMDVIWPPTFRTTEGPVLP
jgi:branched-chain amino acid transport system substrate-binding protein